MSIPLSNFKFLVLASMVLTNSAVAGRHHQPSKYTDLNQYVIASPNQGDARTCAFMAATGAMEILLNKSNRNSNPVPFGDTDISERYTISEKESPLRSKSWFENAFLKFDSGVAILARELPFNFYTAEGDMDYTVWNFPFNFSTLPRITLPKVETVFLFSVGNEYSRNVLNETHVEIVKKALIQYESPILLIGNDEDYWHATVITGYDDKATDGDCYELAPTSCEGKLGAFYVRDSFGTRLEKRSYQWFIKRQNSAAVAKFAD